MFGKQMLFKYLYVQWVQNDFENDFSLFYYMIWDLLNFH